MSESTSVRHTPAEPLFQPSPAPRASFGTVLLFLLSNILVLGGFYLMSIAFEFSEVGIWVFAAGLAADVLGFWLVFGIIPSRS